ncbi:RNA-directed DNA polymerase from transposon X-element [Fusarium acutatum]|uniref:RNA-directed DNA polymerase from transposon X-element n=1 Tax=Fusarium acutatum TaxID=78861 RepID=A0A8H4NFC7_9HYPO|nr:RNA-directed DNA polymerase from transposon X-element [Fusarium acutatum]
MTSGLAAGAATPHRSNAAYQVLIESGPPTTFETPTPSQPAKRKRNGPLSTPNPQPHQAPPPQNTAKSQPTEDLRILVRVPEEHHEWAKSLNNYALREATCKTLGLSLVDIPDIHHTATSFAIRPRNKTIRQNILAKEQEVGRCLRASKIELPTTWYNYVVPNCPARLNNILGEMVDIDQVIEDEVLAQTNLKPISENDGQNYGQTEATETTTLPTEGEGEDGTARTPRAAPSQQTRKQRAQSHSEPDGNTSGRQDSAMDIDSITVTRKNHLHIAQSNVGKVSPAHTAFLQLCWAEGIDIILIQEPWVSLAGRNFFNSHPGYDAYVPVDSWSNLDDRPRVITYVKKGTGLKTQQRRPWDTRDLLWLEVNGHTFINVYRPPHDAYIQATNILLDITPPSNCVIGGDFNAYHSLWEPDVPQPRNQGNNIAKWAATHRLAYIGEVGVQTHAAGHVLNLTFSNIPFARAEVADALHSGADHEGILITVPSPKPLTCVQHRLSVPEDKLEAFAGLVSMGLTPIPFPSATPTPQELDDITESLTGALTTAIQTVGRESKKQGHKARKNFLKVVRQEKRNFWRERVDAVESDKDLYKIIEWHNLGPSIKAPPLVVDGKSIDEPMEKAEALRTALLERFTDADDLDYDPLTAHIIPRNLIPWQAHVSEAEVRDATIAVKSTSPDHIRRLFQACINIGYHPRSFRTAEVVMLSKPNKKDLTSTRSWRPIALLSCLDKGLERLLARRVASTALAYKVISPQQAGAIPTRSATDLLACVTHDIEHSLENRRTATMMTLDVQGAFDAVLRRRLMIRMLQQGWPRNLIKFVGSFMEHRQARVRLEDTVTETKEIKCGSSQGSPLSPILFILYIADIFLQDTEHRFGYADDICVLRTGQSLEENAEKLGEDLGQILGWGAEHKVKFDPEKCELEHFTRTRDNIHSPEVAAPELNFTISEQPDTPVRWLGVWLARKLMFRHHAVTTCVLPVLTYGAEAWYAGSTKSRKIASLAKTETVPTRQEHLLDEISKVLDGAIRAVLPVWQTTPKETLYRDSGVPTAKIALEQSRYRFGHRLRAVDKEHPLARRAARRPFPPGRRFGELQPARTRLQLAAELIPEFPRPCYIPRQHLPNYGPPTGNKSKKEVAQLFRAWLKELPDSHAVVYSDGSISTNGAVGWGYAIYQNRRKIHQGKGRLGLAEVFDGEAEGATHDLIQACRIRPGQVIHVCLDNTSVIQGLTGEIPESSQDAFRTFQRIVSIASVEVRWVTGHEDIEGNEEADRLAKEGAALPADTNHKPTLAGAHRLARVRPNEQFASW